MYLYINIYTYIYVYTQLSLMHLARQGARYLITFPQFDCVILSKDLKWSLAGLPEDCTDLLSGTATSKNKNVGLKTTLHFYL